MSNLNLDKVGKECKIGGNIILFKKLTITIIHHISERICNEKGHNFVLCDYNDRHINVWTKFSPKFNTQLL